MRVGFDMDGVLANFNKGFVNLLSKFVDHPLPEVTDEWPNTWHYGGLIASPEANEKAWQTIKNSATFWRDLDPMPDAHDFLSRLPLRGHELYFITNRMGIDPKLQTEIWLQRYGQIPVPTVLLSPYKGMCAIALGLDYYIDDHTDYCYDVSVQAPKTRCYMRARPWNEVIEGVPRITLTEFAEVLGI